VLQGLLELVDRDPSSPLIHADAEREAVSYGRLLGNVRACTCGLDQLDPCRAGTAWVSVHDPYLLLVAVLGDSIPLNRRGKIPRRHMARLLGDRL
jgi:hypothetical protein